MYRVLINLNTLLSSHVFQTRARAREYGVTSCELLRGLEETDIKVKNILS